MHGTGRWTTTGLLLLALWLAQSVCLASAAPMPPVVLAADEDGIALSSHIGYRHDISDVDVLDDAWRHVDRGDFAPIPNGISEFGFQRGAYWFHVRLFNRHRDEQRWVLLQQYALSDHFDVHVRYADGRRVSHFGGDSLPFDARSIRYRQPNMLLDLPYDKPVDVLVRVESQSSMQVPLVLYTRTAFTELSRDAQFAIGIYYGILLALFFYNLVLWLSLRDASYFWYLFHISAFGLVLFTLSGLGFEYLWPHSPWIADKSVPVSICLALIGMQQFARTFLDMPRRSPRGNLVSLALITFFAVLGLAALWLPYRISTPIASRAVLVGVLWIVIAAVAAVRRGERSAQLFLLAWAMFLLGTTMFTLIAFGIVPKTFATEYGVQIGSAMEMLLLSIALGNRYASLRTENERIIREANAGLERKVAHRTQELRSTLLELEDAHARLSDYSRRDGLTGLYNRTYFREALQGLLAVSAQQRSPLSLLMIDLDHFKSINDRHGHLVGDDCLRFAATRIAASSPDAAVVARVGGEEFMVALPDTHLDEALAIAESIRIDLVAMPCRSQGHAVRVSASVGVHVLSGDDLDNDDLDMAFSGADRAMYRAKADGRDCVRTAARVDAPRLP